MTDYRRFLQSKDLCHFIYPYDDNMYFANFLKSVHGNNEPRLHELLSEEGAISRINEETQETLLHIAARFGTVALVNRIIQLGAHVNIRDIKDQTPLYRAVVRSAEMVKLFLNNGADVNIVNRKSITPLQRALLCGSIETVELLLSKVYSIELSLNEEQEIPTNDFEKCREVVKICLDRDIDLNWNKYPVLLHFVAKYGDAETFTMVLHKSNNFDINALSPDYHTLLHVLVDAGRESLVKQILDYGADVNRRGDMRKTGLHYAIMKSNSTIVRLLLKYGADVHHTVDIDNTPLANALKIENKEIVEMLLVAGADVNAESKHFGTLFHEACGGSGVTFWRDLRDICISKFALNYIDTNKRWHGSSLEIIQLLIESGANIHAKNEVIKATPLLEACGAGRFDVVQLLVGLGADLHLMDAQQNTALHYAIVENNIDIINFLLYSGLNINATNNNGPGNTPLRRLIEKDYDNNLYVDMIEFVADNGADVNATDLHGDNLILAAIRRGQPEEVVCLLELKASIKIPIGNYSLSPYSDWCTNGETDTMALRQFSAFLATKEEDISRYRKIRIINDEDDDEEIFPLAESFFQDCKLEIEEMKSRQICEVRRVSYFDFLTKELLDVVLFTSCEELMKVLDSGEYREEFPCYVFMLEKRIERVKKLRDYIDMIKDFLKKYSKVNLPLVALGEIFSYWSVGDVRNFGRALSVKKE